MRRDLLLRRLWSKNRKFAASLEAGLIEPSGLPTHVGFVFSYYFRFASLAVKRGRNRALRRIRVEGEEHLDAVRRRGRGMIVVSAHIGDFEAAGASLSRAGITPVVVSRQLMPRWRESVFTGVRRRCGMVVRDRDETRLHDLADDLARGRAILMMIDRHVPGPVLHSSFLDRRSAIPLAAAVLATRTGAPIVCAATWRADQGESIVWYGPPKICQSIEDAQEVLSDCALHLATLIKTWPGQWHVPADLGQLSWVDREGEREPAVTDLKSTAA